jgi:hypothetical protein
VKRSKVALVGLEEMNDEPCVRCAVAVSRAAKVSGGGCFCESLFRVRGKGLRHVSPPPRFSTQRMGNARLQSRTRRHAAA